MLSIKNTFIHVQDEEPPAPRKRSHSAPAGASFAGSSPTKPLRSSKRRGRRNCKRWADLVRCKIESEATIQLEQARSLRRLRAESLTPRKRVVLDGRVYIEFKHRVFEDNRDVLCLQLLGVIREKGDVVELWAADEALGNETMQLILGEAERMQRVRDDHCFQVILESVPPFVFKWKSTLTLQGAWPNFCKRRREEFVSDFTVCFPSLRYPPPPLPAARNQQLQSDHNAPRAASGARQPFSAGSRARILYRGEDFARAARRLRGPLEKKVGASWHGESIARFRPRAMQFCMACVNM